ncbi:zinc-dependent metalloprotease [uncultured Brevundimonas sp.]|uniref:zinc-dependent metalloprotease n=1 Tax=uncultured Brevundimonas sp. TaxID=213418 RepID=UPI00259750E7|nr:zinc-dependent metalloprotease [uncultured Brevundimonas sp.]
MIRGLMTATALALVLATGATGPATAGPATAPAASEQRTDGLFPVVVDVDEGAVKIELPAPGVDGVMARVIHFTTLRTGVGSAVTGLDRAQIGPTHILVFRRMGDRVVIEYENPAYRAEAGSGDEQAAARDAFLRSVVWSGPIDRRTEDGGAVVDIGKFLTWDSTGIAAALKQAGQGAFKPVADLSLVDASAARVFPENLELEALLTFSSDDAGREVSRIAPDGRLVSFTVHHSFVKLPDAGYEVRPFDPRTGAMNQVVHDFSAPLDAPIARRLAARFRLEKTDPAAARSTVRQPIVFCVDRAAPEPIRSALVEGASWWAEAFDRAGFIDAYRVEVLPEGVDPMDARYNVINWVNRATRSWSYGQSVIDPRTGEIVKGSVLLGSLRVRQDMMILEGLAGAAQTGSGAQDDAQRIALARIRQLAAHEVGHAIGLMHNFAASTQDRASVMDYPTPRIAIGPDQTLDFSDAYGVGMGAWDDFAIDWLYAPADAATLDRKAREGAARLRFVSDADARNASDGQPWGSLWDEGADPVEALGHAMQVRRIALSRFGLNVLPAGSAVNDLRRRLVPIYLFHRYQVDAAAKLIGGVDYGFPIVGDGRESAAPVSAERQSQALEALLTTLDPAALTLPVPLLDLLAAQQSGDTDVQHQIEVFPADTGRGFDAGAAADVAAEVTLSALFAPERVNRLIEATARDPGALGLPQVLARTSAVVFAPAEGRPSEAARRVQARYVLTLAELRRGGDLSSTAAALIDQDLATTGQRLRGSRAADPVQRAHDRWLGALLADRERLEQILKDRRHPVAVPPGSPIGDQDCWLCAASAVTTVDAR